MAIRRVDYLVENTRLWLVEYVNYEQDDCQAVVVVARSEEDAKNQGLFAMFRPEEDRELLTASTIGTIISGYRIALEELQD